MSTDAQPDVLGHSELLPKGFNVHFCYLVLVGKLHRSNERHAVEAFYIGLLRQKVERNIALHLRKIRWLLLLFCKPLLGLAAFR